MAPPPIVTGISPKEGPPGTRVTVRGEFLGTKAQDLIGLTICGCDCLLSAEWKSQNKIIARSGLCKGRGDIVVTTRSGGQGTSTVQFRGYHETIGPMKESAVWVEEAPVQSFVWGRRALSPTHYQQDDPLGLSVEGNEKKFPEDELCELFGDCSGELTSEKFHPGWFLLQHHHATTLDDLKAGLAYLRRKVNSQKEGQLSFLKANVGAVMEQLETIVLLKEQFDSDVKKYGNNPTDKLESAIKISMAEANKLFDDVLARRDRADSTRSALALMQRYRFLFCMPVSIEKNIKRGNYDLVINDYARVKNLFGNTDVDIFKRVLEEIEDKIAHLRNILRKKLEETPFALESQKKIIRNLVNLEANGDPAWDAIVSHAAYLDKSIKSCVHDFLSSEGSGAGDECGGGGGGGEGSSSSSSSTTTTTTTTTTTATTTTTTNNNSKTGKLSGNSLATPGSVDRLRLSRVNNNQANHNVPLRVECVEALCDVVAEQLPDLWRLGQSYFTGQLHVSVDTEKQIPFKNLVLSCIQRASEAMRESCGSNVAPAWLLHSLRSIRQMYAALIHLDLPSEALDIFGKFLFDLRLQCLVALFRQTADNISGLQRKETWQLEYLPNEDGGITKLPCQFEDMVTEVSEQARVTAIACGPRETPLFTSTVQQSLYHNSVKTLFVSFARCLRQLAFSGSEEASEEDDPSVSQLVGSPSCYRIRESKHRGLTTPTWEKCLLISLSNIRYTLNVVLPRVVIALKSRGYPDLSLAEGWRSDWTHLETLDGAVLEAYLERRCDPLVGTIEPSMYLGGLEWDSEIEPTHVRPYAREALANLIAVHAEVNRVSPGLLKRVLSHIVETIAEELARLMSCVVKFGQPGIIQARADITMLRRTLDAYCTPRAKSFFEEALDAIPHPASKDSMRIEALLSKVTASMQLQICCLADRMSVVPRTEEDPLRTTTV